MNGYYRRVVLSCCDRGRIGIDDFLKLLVKPTPEVANIMRECAKERCFGGYGASVVTLSTNIS